MAKLLPQRIRRRIKRYIKHRFGNIDVTRPYIVSLNSDGRFKNMVAVVTGGSGTIGRAICFRLAAEGATVYVCGTTEKKIVGVVEEIRKARGIAHPCELNVNNSDDISEAFERIIERQGRIDILVASAGGSARQNHNTLAKQDVAVIDEVLSVNLRGAILCSREAAKQMIKQQSGKIIVIGSSIGGQGKAGFSEYAAAKGAIITFVKSLGMELGRYGINVNCVSPGIVQRGKMSPVQLEKLKKTNYMNTYGKPEDVSNMVAFLSSDEASFIAGQNFFIDGGRCLGLKGD